MFARLSTRVKPLIIFSDFAGLMSPGYYFVRNIDLPLEARDNRLGFEDDGGVDDFRKKILEGRFHFRARARTSV